MTALRWILWFLDETHIVVTGVTALTFLWTRSTHVAYFIIGAMGCNVTAKILKKVLKQERPLQPAHSPSSPPKSSTTRKGKKSRPPPRLKKTYGMPSTHSASIAFFMTYILLSLLVGHGGGRSGISGTTGDVVGKGFDLAGMQGMVKGLICLGTVLWGGGILWSRVYLGYHTPSQVVVGTFIGTLTSTLWFLLYPSFHSAPIPDLLAYGPGARDVRVWGIQSWEGRLEGLIGWAYGLIGR